LAKRIEGAKYIPLAKRIEDLNRASNDERATDSPRPSSSNAPKASRASSEASEASQLNPEARKRALFKSLEANNNWNRDHKNSEIKKPNAIKKEKANQKRLELHFNVWYQNLCQYFSVPPIPNSFRPRTEFTGARSIATMYNEAHVWAEAMIREIEETRARGDVSTFTDAEFDSLIATLGWEALLRRVDPDLRSSINPAPAQSTSPSLEPDDEGDLYD
jgi:hypothetical protein